MFETYSVNDVLRRRLANFKLAKICRAARVEAKGATDFRNGAGHVKLSEYQSLCKHFGIFVWDPITKAAEDPFGAVQRRLRREKLPAEDLAERFSDSGLPCTVRGVDDVACSKMTSPSTPLGAMFATYELVPCKEDGTQLKGDADVDAFARPGTTEILEESAA